MTATMTRRTRPTPTPEQQTAAVAAWLRKDPDPARELGMGGADELSLDLRALAVGTTTAGGYTAPAFALASALSLALTSTDAVRAAAEGVPVPSGPVFRYPTASEEAGAVVAEGADPGTADPTFGAVDFTAQTFTSKRVVVSSELAEDSRLLFALGWLGRILGRRIGRIQNATWTPTILSEATLGVTAAGAAAITAAEVLALFFSVDAAYRGEGSGWMMSDAAAKAIFSLATTTGALVFEGPEDLGAPLTLMGRPVFINAAMPALATGAKTVLFGQLRDAIKVVDFGPLRLVRDVESHAATDQEAFTAYLRSDAHLLVPSGAAPVKYLQQA